MKVGLGLKSISFSKKLWVLLTRTQGTLTCLFSRWMFANSILGYDFLQDEVLKPAWQGFSPIAVVKAGMEEAWPKHQ